MPKIKWKIAVFSYIGFVILVYSTLYFASIIFGGYMPTFLLVLLSPVTILLSPLLPIGIFLASSYRTEKKILNNTYTHKSWILYNVILTVVLYVLATLLLGVFMIFVGWDWDSLATAILAMVAAWVTPIMVVVFSLIPSFFIYRKHNRSTHLG